MTAPIPYDTMSTTSTRSELMFKNCCCCIPLRIGCFILGYLNLIYNSFHTLALVTVTTYLGVSTHGFDHFDSERPQPVSEDTIDVEAVEKPMLTQIGFLLMVVLCANVAWLLINVACLVGLHKKRPGPIRVYIGFASARLLLSLAGFIYLVMTSSAHTQALITHSVDLGLTAYFLFVYYVYTVQLEREQLELPRVAPEVSTVDDISFIYPTKLDKEHLVIKY